MSRTSQKYVPPPTVKVKKKTGLSHSELAARWAEQGGKFVEPEKKQWSKADIDRARKEKEAREEAEAKAGKERVVGQGLLPRILI